MRDRVRRRHASPRALLLALGFAGISCQHFAPPACSGEIANLAAPRRTLHVRVELSRDGEPQRHDVVVRVAAGRISAVGLTPLGTVAFALAHDAAGIEVENRVGRYLGYEPRRVYDAIAHAALAGPALPGAPPVTAVLTRGAEEVVVENDRCGYRARVVWVSDERA